MRDVRARLDTIRANIGFDRVQQMRESSPTGGALGQVTEFENRLLQSTLGNLEQSQSREQILENLGRIESIYLDIVHGEGNWSRDKDGKVSVGRSQERDQPEGPDFSNMGIAEIGQVDINALTPEQMDALDARMRELGL